MYTLSILKRFGLIGSAAVGMGTVYYLVIFFPTASNQGYYPQQPLPFSHKLHAGLHKIDCRYCHSEVEKSIHASIPAVEVCMNCHTVVKKDSPYIQMLTKAYQDKKPIEWIRVHELPDYVYFPHKRHVAAGLNCEACHGDVANMERIEQHGALTMGWCMSCHRGETTPHDILTKSTYQKDPFKPVAPTECSTCHK